MALAAHLTAQLDAELDASRRVIERVSEAIYDWRPHEKSWTAKDLATHIAALVSWGGMILATDELDFGTPEMKNWTPPTADSVDEILGMLEKNGAQVRSVLSGMSDEELEATWVMRDGEQIYSSDPKAFAFARWVLAHQAHHRGELMVYLRLNDIPLPGIFGPTADEQGM